jgi:hypothetical protein
MAITLPIDISAVLHTRRVAGGDVVDHGNCETPRAIRPQEFASRILEGLLS